MILSANSLSIGGSDPIADRSHAGPARPDRFDRYRLAPLAGGDTEPLRDPNLSGIEGRGSIDAESDRDRGSGLSSGSGPGDPDRMKPTRC